MDTLVTAFCEKIDDDLAVPSQNDGGTGRAVSRAPTAHDHSGVAAIVNPAGCCA